MLVNEQSYYEIGLTQNIVKIKTLILVMYLQLFKKRFELKNNHFYMVI